MNEEERALWLSVFGAHISTSKLYNAVDEADAVVSQFRSRPELFGMYGESYEAE